MTIGRGIRCAAARNPNNPAIVLDDKTLDYAALIRRMAQISHIARHHLKLKAGERVALIAPNCLPYVEIVAGMSDTGVIVATLSPRLTRTELSDILDDCLPSALIVHPDCRESIDPLWAGTWPILWLDESYEALIKSAPDNVIDYDVDEGTAFALAYTSGTTGRPKGVLLSHRSRSITFLSMAAEYRCFGPDDNFLALAPMCHGAGFVFACAALHFGGTTTLLNTGSAETILSRICQGDVSGVFMVPTHFARLFDLPSATLAKYRHHALRTIISNAAALPLKLKEAAIEHFGEGLLHETYGSTEGGIVTNIRPVDQLRKPGSVGHPFPAMEIELRSADGRLSEIGEPGELFCRGPTSFNGYWQRPEETREALFDGWVTVGDIAKKDNEGFISIIDRKKDMVITGGLNVYPREVENVIASLTGVREVAVIGTPDGEWGESLHAFVVPDTDHNIDTDSLLAEARHHLASYKVPRSISLLTELPRNAGGKILKTALRESMHA